MPKKWLALLASCLPFTGNHSRLFISNYVVDDISSLDVTTSSTRYSVESVIHPAVDVFAWVQWRYLLLHASTDCWQHIMFSSFHQTQGNSMAMELAGLKECLHDVLNKLKLRVATFISDRHVQVRKYMRETYGENRHNQQAPQIKHYFDIWHVAKGELYSLWLQSFLSITWYSITILIWAGLRKELAKIGVSDKSGLINRWTNSLVNHLYWCAVSTPDGNADVMEAKFVSITNHIVNVHKHDNPLFKECQHKKRRKGEKKKEYFKRG